LALAGVFEGFESLNFGEAKTAYICVGRALPPKKGGFSACMYDLWIGVCDLELRILETEMKASQASRNLASAALNFQEI
tara:strand:- start:1553 stop:1789 length:237 start_codon:yes stop_codon:yes gene_type:complete